MNKKNQYADSVKETLILTLAVAIIAAAVYFFLVPSHASVSSISGLGIILSNFVPLPLSAITMILNVVLLIIGFFTCGREFGAKTVYTSIMLPLFLGLFEKIFPDFYSMTDSQELDVLCYILVVSVALVYDKKTVVLSVLGTYFNGIVLDHFIFNQDMKRRVCIITQKEEELRHFILYELHSGATIYEAIGAYTMEKHNEIITIVDKTEYQKLMKYINQVDPKAFITIYNVSNMRYQPKI